MRFPDQQQASATAAFGRFSVDQALHIFDRTKGSGITPGVIEVAPRTWWIQPGMVNVGLFETDEGLIMVDAGCAGDGPALVEAVRSVSDKPLRTVVYTHAHSDHAYGLWAFIDAGETPEVIAHSAFPDHIRRYIKTSGLNARINGQQAAPGRTGWLMSEDEVVWPTTLFDETHEFSLGGERFVLRHGKGETDDHVWLWAANRRVLAVGDMVTGYLPNAGNPKKVQRYAEEWADAAQEMAALEPVAMIPGHGEPVTDGVALHDELTAMARYLRVIVDHALEGLNNGVLPDHIVDTLEIPEELRDHPRLPAVYDQPQFLCRNVIRRYSGWWDGYPSHLLPARQEEQAAEIAQLAGGAQALASRARVLAETNLRLACHVAEWAFLADPGNEDARAAYREILEMRALQEGGLMAQVNLRVSAAWVAAAQRD